MGEHKRRPMRALAKLKEETDQPQVVDTLGGRIHIRWDEGAATTPHGQLVFFAEFLATTGVFERWVSVCPLAGHRRYAHITALRGDAVAAQALGMG